MYLRHIIRYIVNIIIDHNPSSRSVFTIALRDIRERVPNRRIGHSSMESHERKRRSPFAFVI